MCMEAGPEQTDQTCELDDGAARSSSCLSAADCCGWTLYVCGLIVVVAPPKDVDGNGSVFRMWVFVVCEASDQIVTQHVARQDLVDA